MQPPDRGISYLRYTPNGWEAVNARVINETPVSLAVNGQEWLTFMCTPTQLEALGIGFLYNEGIIQSAAELVSVHLCKQATLIDIWLDHNAEKPPAWRRTSGCAGGVTGAAALPKMRPDFSEEPISPAVLLECLNQLIQSQELYREARGIHSSALSDGRSLLLQAEDIGRHNTLDKIAGLALLGGVMPQRRILLTTGRVSSEMLQKAARLRAGIVLSRTSPTLLSIEAAKQYGISLIGYARRAQLNVYTHPERLMEKETRQTTPAPAQRVGELCS